MVVDTLCTWSAETSSPVGQPQFIWQPQLPRNFFRSVYIIVFSLVCPGSTAQTATPNTTRNWRSSSTQFFRRHIWAHSIPRQRRRPLESNFNLFRWGAKGQSLQESLCMTSSNLDPSRASLPTTLLICCEITKMHFHGYLGLCLQTQLLFLTCRPSAGQVRSSSSWPWQTQGKSMNRQLKHFPVQLSNP